MTAAAKLKVLDIACWEHPFRHRLPFRYGVVTVTRGRQAIVRARIACEDGGEGVGHAAETLAAKWFDKDLRLSDAGNRRQLRKSLELASRAYRDAPWLTSFDLFAEHHAGLISQAARLGLNALVAGFGPALIDRAVLDALCRIRGASFGRALNANLPGIRAHPIAPDLAGFDIAAFLSRLRPSARIQARHTVGLVDPLTAADQDRPERLDDGLPETLEEVIAVYGNRYFKLKLGGRTPADLKRLKAIAAVLDRSAHPYRVTLDGNEQYDRADAAVNLWQAMRAEPALERLCASTLFIEQPIGRQTALSHSVAPLARLRPVIIDESDADMEAFVRARAHGYAGVSSKSCKGVYKALLNLARCRSWNAAARSNAFFMSAEDLTTQAGVSVQQDLALASLLGMTHVERNAHHFIDGFGARPRAEALAHLKAHPDLYHERDGRVRLRLERGELAIGSLECVGFGSGAAPDLSETPVMPRARWP